MTQTGSNEDHLQIHTDHYEWITTFFAVLFTVGMTWTVTADSGKPAVVHVKKNQTLNEAIADVEGPVRVLLPPGVTHHTEAITRNETVVLKGRGEEVSTLRPSPELGPDEGVALVTQTEGYDGDFVLSDLTYDRAFQPGANPGPSKAWHDWTPEVSTGAEVFRVAARDRVVFRNVTIHHFDFGARKGKRTTTCPFVFTYARGKHTDKESLFQTDRIRFENVRIDFKDGGGIRRRPGGRSIAFRFGVVDRIRIDEQTLIRGHLKENANPEYTVGKVFKGRSGAGTIYGMSLRVKDHAFIAGEYRNCDYGVWRSGGPVRKDAVIEWRMDLPRAGFGDMFWHGRAVDGGHMIFRDVRLVGHETEELWNDYGLRVFGNWKSVTVDGCTVKKRGHCLAFARGDRLGQVTIRDTTLVPNHGGRWALTMKGYRRIDGVKIDDLNVYADPDSDRAYYEGAINLGVKEGGGAMVSDVRAEGYTGHLLRDNTGDDFSVKTSQVHGRSKDFVLPDGYDFALMRERPGKALFQPDYHAGSKLPGYFSASEVMTPARGNPTHGWKGSEIEVGYTRKGLDLFFQVKGDKISSVTEGRFQTADRWRIGVALGEPEKAKTWFEITVAADGKDKDPHKNTRVKVRRFPGGKTIETEGVVSALQHHSYGRKRWGVWIPWDALGIDPASEPFFIGRTISLDLAYIDVDNGKESGAWQFLGKSGVLGKKDVTNFKRVYLRDVNWDDTG